MKQLYALLLAMFMPLLAMADNGDMRGFATVANDNYEGGIVTLSPTRNTMVLKYAYAENGELGFAIGGWDGGGAVYCGNNQYIVYIFTDNAAVNMDLSTGKVIPNTKTTMSNAPVSMTYDYIDECVYGCFKNSGSWIFGKFDPGKKPYNVTKIADCERYVAIAASPDGTIYAITSGGKLIQVDKETGDSMEIGSVGLRTYSFSCATFDWNTGKMYWQNADADGTGIMYTVNTTNASTTRLYSYRDWCALLNFDFEYTHTAGVQLPPAAPTKLAVNFTGASKTGKVSFKTPTTLVDGNKGTGALVYTVSVDGKEAVKGDTSFGATVAVDVEVETSGEHKFAVTVANEAGESNEAELTQWVGYDQPKTVTDIQAHYADGKITLTWAAPSEGVHGAYFSAAELTYEVYREDELIATVSECNHEDNIGVPATPTPYTYGIRAVQVESKSDLALSRKIYAGAYDTPFTADFNSEENGLNGFTVINGGDEDYTWRWANNAAQMPTYGHEQADDWLITPPIHLTAGVAYRFRFDACCGGGGNNAKELFNVCYGTETTAEAMTTELIPTTLVDHNSYKTYGVEFTVDATGDYCFGIHCTSDIHYFLQVDNIAVREADDYGKPAIATGLVVTPDPMGALTATVQFVIPSVDIYGDPIPGVDKVKVYRDEALIYTDDTPQEAGATYTYVDNVPEVGYHTYVVATVNSKGQSPFLSARCFVGVNKPGSATNVTAAETDTWGEARVSWDAPETDADGEPINPDLVRYDIYNHIGNPIAEDIEGTSYTFQAVQPGEKQEYMGFRVVAKTIGGEAEYASCGMLPLGEPFKYPYAESFADSRISSTFAAAVSLGSGGFIVCDDSQSTVSCTSQDNDNGFLCIEGTPSIDAYNLDIISIYTGKIEVTGDTPSLSFYYKGNGRGSTNSMRVYVREWHGYGTTELTANPITTNISNNWERVQLPLSEWKGKVVVFQIEISNVLDRYTYIDNIRVEDTRMHDLEVYNFSTPSKTRAGEAMTATMLVQNLGFETANDWSVVLRRDGDVVWTQTGIELESGKLCMVYLYDVPPVFGSEELTYTAEVIYAADEYTDNNTTEAKIVELIMPEWPVVDEIKGERQGDDFVIEWARPVGTDNESITDSFEDYYAWEKETFGDWHVYDYDGLNTAGMMNIDIPVAGTPAAFYVFQGIAHTGDQCLCAFSSTRGNTEDWLISPALSGAEQTISFWECGFNTAFYPETSFQVMYSTTDNMPYSFLPLTGTVPASGDWTLREAKLPAGTRYFAIVATSTQIKGGALFVDDITYVPSTGSVDDLKGFNIYRDGVKLANVDAETLTYTDKDVATDGESHDYFVTAVYDKGESVPSATVGFVGDAIQNVFGTKAENVVYDLSGRRVFSLTKGVNIINGKKVVR